MINPADRRGVYFYTPAEVAAARDIQRTKPGAPKCYSDGTPAPTFETSLDTWAQKVLTWYGRFIQLLRRYARALHSVALAQVAIWKNLRAGLSLPRMLKQDEHEQQAERTARPHWINNPQQSRDDRAHNGTPIQYHTEKRSHKTARRAQVIRLTTALQTAAK